MEIDFDWFYRCKKRKYINVNFGKHELMEILASMN
jgi:hypothetical protein